MYCFNINIVGNKVIVQNLDRVSFSFLFKDQLDLVMVYEVWVIDKLIILCFKVLKRRVIQQGNYLFDVNFFEFDGYYVVIFIFGVDMVYLLIYFKFCQG